jgi:hypothetical protein
MLYAVSGTARSPWQAMVLEELVHTLQARGHHAVSPDAEPKLVLHLIDTRQPRPFRRHSRATFVVGIADQEDGPWLEKAYPVLIRTISNVLIWGGFGPDGTPAAEAITPELGCYPIIGGLSASLGENLYQRLEPLIFSQLIIDNLFDEDLPQELQQGTPVTEEMTWASRVLDTWHLFPTPFPIQSILPAEDYRHLRRIFSIGGLSYGNLSARHDGTRFWMSASGVDKGKIGTVSEDILLVKEYDQEARAIRLSVAPGSRPHRVSVDAVEHWEVYRRHPEISAMIHIHAWVDGVVSTSVNYPCGTVEMGVAMADLFDADPDPARTIIGLRNHGITATGPSFHDIIERLEGRVRTQVPMS